MTKQELFDNVSEKYKWKNNKIVSKLKRIIFNTYTGKYIYYLNRKFKVNEIDKLYLILEESK